MNDKAIRLKSLRTELSFARKFAKTIPHYAETVSQLKRIVKAEGTSGQFSLYSKSVN